MNITVNTTKKFEKDLESFDKQDQKRILGTLEILYKSLGSGNGHFYNTVKRIRRVALNGYESSLHVARISDRLRVFMTVDEDPIFERTIITLVRVTEKTNVVKTYKDTAESILRNQLVLNSR